MPEHFITLEQAKALTKKYRDEKEIILIPSLRNLGILPICESFNREEIEILLAKSGAEGIRIYMGMDEEQKVRIVLVATNSSEEDMLPDPSVSDSRDIVEEGVRCPHTCPPPSPLNED